jgi:hypothetical protein
MIGKECHCEEPPTVHRPTNALQLLGIAINAKLGGIPWRPNTPISNELTIGIGSFTHPTTKLKHFTTATTFDNSGTFHSFDYFEIYETTELAGFIECTIQEYSKINGMPKRIIIHYYNDFSTKTAPKIEDLLQGLGINIPIFVVVIEKHEAHNLMAFGADGNPVQSGTYVDLGGREYLLYNNNPLPLRLSIKSVLGLRQAQPPGGARVADPRQRVDVGDREGRPYGWGQPEPPIPTVVLINQLYQFSRIYWFSTKLQTLPATVKYPEFIAHIAPYFPGENIPPITPNGSMWFL